MRRPGPYVNLGDGFPSTRQIEQPVSPLIAHWAGEENMVDSVGGRNGNKYGSMNYQDGYIGKCFSGSGVYLSAADSAFFEFAPSDNFSFNAKVRINPDSTSGGCIMCKGGNSRNYALWVTYHAEKGLYLRLVLQNNWYDAPDYSITAGIWHDILWGYSAGVSNVFVDGVKKIDNIEKTVGVESGVELSFGISYRSSPYTHVGDIDGRYDELKFYSGSIA